LKDGQVGPNFTYSTSHVQLSRIGLLINLGLEPALLGVEVQLLGGGPVLVERDLENTREEICANIAGPGHAVGVCAVEIDVLVVLADTVVIIVAALEVSGLCLKLLGINAGAEVVWSVSTCNG
jgi:hypothetical protein